MQVGQVGSAALHSPIAQALVRAGVAPKEFCARFPAYSRRSTYFRSSPLADVCSRQYNCGARGPNNDQTTGQFKG